MRLIYILLHSLEKVPRIFKGIPELQIYLPRYTPIVFII